MIAAVSALVVAAVAAAATHEEKAGGLPQLNPADFAPQLVWLAVTFVVLYLILSRVTLPRIGEVIEERRIASSAISMPPSASRPIPTRRSPPTRRP